VPTATRADSGAGSAPRGALALLGSTVSGEPLPRLRRRLTPASFRGDPVWGWLAPIIVCLLSGILQFWNITTPHDITFDETYYAKDAYSLLVKHYAANFVSDGNDDNGSEADKIINSGSTRGIFSSGVSEVVHPEVGKWMIAVGEWMFGMNPLGWRFSSALVGTLMVLVMCRLVRRLTGSTVLGCIAGLLLSLDGLHFVMSRIALLDIFLAFWLLCAVHCLVADRDWARARFARRYEMTPRRDRFDFGPVRGFLLRPWRILAGVCFGLACGTKWSAIFVVAGFGLLIWAWDSGMRRAAGVRWAPLKSFVVDAIPSLVSIVLVGLVVYVVSWMGFLTHAEKFEDAFGHAANSDDWTWSSVNDHPHNAIEGVAHDLDILWNYHKEVYEFHTGSYLASQYHPWQSNPGGWLVLNRPIAFAVETTDAIPNCPVGQECVKEILALGNPVLWWGGVLALFAGLGYWLTRRDWRFGVPIVGVLTTWLPWFKYDDRQIFFYYGISIIPFTLIAVTLILGKVLGRAGAGYARRMTGGLVVATFVVGAAVSFAYFYPILSDRILTQDDWHSRIWLTYWNKSVPAPGSTTSAP
jgi:dolichyl-phosphate-mannose-protein mannosyltransferase